MDWRSFKISFLRAWVGVAAQKMLDMDYDGEATDEDRLYVALELQAAEIEFREELDNIREQNNDAKEN